MFKLGYEQKKDLYINMSMRVKAKEVMTVLDKHLIADAEACTGCRICEIICSATHKCSMINSRIKILKMEELDVNIPVIRVNCDLCNGKMKCVKFCPAHAIKFMEIGEAASLRKRNKLGQFPCPVIGVAPSI